MNYKQGKVKGVMETKFKNYLIKISMIIEEKTMFLAIKKGLIMIIPIIIIGSFSMVLKYMPLTLYQEFISKFGGGIIYSFLDILYSVTFGVLSLYVVIAISYSYSVISLKNKINSILLPIISICSYLIIIGLDNNKFNMTLISNRGMFTAILISVISSKIYIKIINSKFINRYRKPNGIDFNLEDAIKGILPAFIIIISSLVFRELFNLLSGYYNIQNFFADYCSSFFLKLRPGLFSGILYLILVQGLFFVGINGNSVFANVGDIFKPGIYNNYNNILNGTPPTEIVTKTSIDTFAYMGGAGAVISLIIAIVVFSRKKELKSLCKLGGIPAIFNISEIIHFGLPIVLNPIFFIPFIIIPIVFTIITYLAMYFSLVPMTYETVHWTTPIIISGYVATGSIRGSILQVFLVLIGSIIYLPFIRIYEDKLDLSLKENTKELVKVLQRAEEINYKAYILNRNDKLGWCGKILLNDLREDLKAGKVFLVYQPQVSENRKIIGLEALIRWKHSTVGFIYPPLIIELAKEGKILSELESYIFIEAGKVLKDINSRISPFIKISVNVTADSLLEDSFEDNIDNVVKKYELDTKNLAIEITEQDELLNLESVEKKLVSLNNKGHKIIIDDFGMGHTSIKYLQNYKFNVVKIDGSLVRGIDENKRNLDIISSIVFLSKYLDFTIISEGVETCIQKDVLLGLGCRIFQGYYYSKPITYEELLNNIEKGYIK